MTIQDMATKTATFTPVQANDVDAALERSLTTEWDAQIVTYPNERFPIQRMDIEPHSRDGLCVE